MPNVMNQILAGFLPWILLFALISIAGAVFRVFLLPKIKGRIGEAVVNSRIRQLDPQVYHLISDVMLPTPEGTTQIDHVIVSRYGIFVLETKAYKGWIYGDEREPQWTQGIYRHKSRFQNPLRQNYKHTKTLADLTTIPHDYFKSVVVFVGDCTFKTAMPPNVVYVRDLVLHIKSVQTAIIMDEQVQEIANTIRLWAGTVTEKQKAGHVAHVRQQKAPASSDAQAPSCPRCRESMILRTSTRDGSRFWGCRRYPACRGIRKVA